MGQPVRRKEDLRLLTGRGRFADDFNIDGQAYVSVLRTPHAHALIKKIDTAAARAAPGVLAVLTGADYLADGLGRAPKREILARLLPDVARRPAAGITQVYPVEPEKVRHVGDITAVVVAETPYQARDALELIEADYEPLPAVIEAAAALEPGAPVVWDWAPDNLCIEHERGDKAATEEAFARAAHVVAIQVSNNRVMGVPMEPRVAIADYDAVGGRFTLHTCAQGVGVLRAAIAAIFGMPEEKVRVLCRDVGGAFGNRNLVFPEYIAALWASWRLGRPVKWLGERSECFLTDPAGRDVTSRAELALDAAGRFLAIRVEHLANFGVEAIIMLPFARTVDFVVGVYDFPAAHVRARGVFTNKGPIGVLRSAGRPEPMFMLERLIDTAAAELGMDPVELRRRNIIPPRAMPYHSATDVTYDSGDFGKNMEDVLKLADRAGFAARRQESRRRGRYRGFGLANYIEWATGTPEERAEIEIRPEGRVELVLGTMDSGQGHETAFAQVLGELLGVPFEAIDLVEGDSDRAKFGAGSHSSRSMRLAGLLIGRAADAIIEKGRRIAAHLLEAAEADITFADGAFTVSGTDRSLGLFQVAAEAVRRADLPDELKGKLEAGEEILEPLTAFPNGCHACEVEVDAETGAYRILRYAAMDDVGRIINPLLVEGQTHGGIAHGTGQATMEKCFYDGESGQLLSGSFLDYPLPRAAMFPPFVTGHNQVPAPNNPLGVKGAGEGGTAAAPPAIVNALIDALRELGVSHIEMPATSERVWRAIRDARRRAGAT